MPSLRKSKIRTPPYLIHVSILLRKLENERRAKDELQARIHQEEMSLKYLLQSRIESLKEEKGAMATNIEASGEFQVNKLNSLMSKLKSEKEKLEKYYSVEVREK